ncbi:esterase family protein [soil metagenome]
MSAFLRLIVLAACGPLAAGGEPVREGNPAPSNVRGAEFPWIHPDFRVTFRVRAPEAGAVAVAGRAADSGMHGSSPYAMERDGDGTWTVTTEPVRPGFHYYELLIDGHRTTDPSSQTFFGWGQPTSGLEVPDPELDFYAFKDVPHGQVAVHWYRSAITGQPRRAYVYSPPGYGKSDAHYPVLYLQHGAGENETSWTWQGKANLILDNLIAAGEAVPMLVVMDCGYAERPGATGPDRRGNEAFGEVLLNDLVPLVDTTYRTRPDRKNRALAGLSMGAGQALSIGFANLDTFASVAAMSGGRSDPLGDTDLSPAELNAQLDLLWLGYGREDGGYDRGVTLHETWEAAGLEHVWSEGPGSHEWQVWRKHLHELAPQLFAAERE